jgi:two-component system, cell cycle response regulator
MKETTMATILIVDDSPEIRDLLNLWLSIDGHEVLEAQDGFEALKLVDSHQPSVVTLDVMLPEMSGIEVCNRIRSNLSGTLAYIIMLSARSGIDDKVAGLEMGADAYLTKPFEPAEVVAQLRVGLRTVEARRNALLDPLTGLFGRRAFDHMFERSVARSARYKCPLSMVVIDIDHFKSVNDRYGHTAGDTVLTEFSRLLRDHCRECDLPFRWGGEEFVWLLPDTPESGAVIAAERLREAVEQHAFAAIERLTISAGVAQLCKAADKDDFFECADAAVLSAKELGRNRVVVGASTALRLLHY